MILEEHRIPNITEVKIINDGRGLRIQFSNHTHFVDKRDIFNIPSWNDRQDNRDENLQKKINNGEDEN